MRKTSYEFLSLLAERPFLIFYLLQCFRYPLAHEKHQQDHEKPYRYKQADIEYPSSYIVRQSLCDRHASRIADMFDYSRPT